MMPVPSRPSPLLKLSPLYLLIVLSGCASAPPPPPAVTVIDNSCKAFKALSWSVDDTPVTSSQIRRHNRTHAELCKK